MHGVFLRILNWLKRECVSVYKEIDGFCDRRRLTVTAFFAMLGCLCASQGKIGLTAAGILALALVAVLIAVPRRKAVFVPALIAFVLFSSWYLVRDIRYENLPEGKFTVEATVCEDPLEQSGQHRTVVTLKDTSADGRPVPGKIRMYVYSTDTDLEAGQQLTIENCKLSLADGVTNPNGFDFNAYLWRNGVSMCASANADKITVTGYRESIKSVLYRLRAKLASVSDKVFREQSDVMRAVLLGDRTLLSDDTYEDFSKVGIAHIIALSGLHVSAIALAVEWLLKKLRTPRTFRYLITMVLLTAYTVMTGSGNSTIRAVIMYGLLCVVQLTGYPSDTLTRLSGALIIQLAVNPLLIGDNGFILSYSSVAAILCFSDVFFSDVRLKKLPGGIRTFLQSGTASFAVQTVTFPLLAGMFYSVSLVSVPVNMICVPFAMVALFAGIPLLILGTVWTSAACILAWPVRMIWKMIKTVCAFTADLGIAQMNASPWPAWALILYFSVTVITGKYLAADRKRQRAGIGAMLIVILIMLIWPAGRIDHLRVTFLDVGYADSAVINAYGDTYVIDCGRNNGIAADYLSAEKRNVRGIFVTHPDSDHAGGLPEILARYPRAKIYLPYDWNDMDVPEDMQSLLDKADVTYLSQGDEVILNDMVLAEVLWPPEGFLPDSDNNGSLVLRIVYSDTAGLFMADLTDEYDVEAAADSTYLKVAHHGSKYATTQQFVDTVTPQISVISVGGNSFGHPTQQVIERLESVSSEIYRTDKSGAIILDIYENGTIDIKTWLEDNR